MKTRNTISEQLIFVLNNTLPNKGDNKSDIFPQALTIEEFLNIKVVNWFRI